MKRNTKSSITLPAEEHRLVLALRGRLGLKSNVEVVRRGLRLLKETTDRQTLKAAYAQASAASRRSTLEEIAELDHLTGDGLD